jgi:hypothetical protein
MNWEAYVFPVVFRLDLIPWCFDGLEQSLQESPLFQQIDERFYAVSKRTRGTSRNFCLNYLFWTHAVKLFTNPRAVKGSMLTRSLLYCDKCE